MKFVLFYIALLASGIASATTTDDIRWYLSAFGGYTHLSSNIKTHYYGYSLSDVHYPHGYNLGGSVGFQIYPLRYEIQYTYLHADTNRYSVNHIEALRIDGGTKANTFMGNFYYDFPEMFASISPFLGVGIGYALMDATLNSTSRFKRPHFNTDQGSFAYQGLAGLTYNCTKVFAINAAYRYTTTTNYPNWGKPLQAQMGSVGLIYRFDLGNHKTNT